MRNFLLGTILLFLFQTSVCCAVLQDTAKESAQSHALTIASFDLENETLAKCPELWNMKSGGQFTATVSDQKPGFGERYLRLESRVQGAGLKPVGVLNHRLKIESCRGKRIRFRSSIHADLGEEGQVIMWLREDLKSGDIGVFDQMNDRRINFSDWAQHEIVADISVDAKAVTVGYLLFGKGEVLIDNIIVEEVDKSVELTLTQGRSTQATISSAPGLFEIHGSVEVRRQPLEDKQDTEDEIQLLLPLPLLHGSQYPLTYHLAADPAESLKNVRIYQDKLQNFVAEVTLVDVAANEKVDLKFSSAVLVAPGSLHDAPETAPIPKDWPEETLPWLNSTWCVDSSNDRIREIGNEIRSETDDVLKIIDLVETQAKAIFQNAKGRAQKLTAVAALDKRGSCTSCGNLVAALLRASNVPARVLAGYPSWSGPLQTHYIVEAYVPNYGWYPIESTLCRSPWPNKNQINVSIVVPEYESKKLAGNRPSAVAGVPYLSLTEFKSNDGSYYAIGTIPGKKFCDHECKTIRELVNSDAEWNEAAMWAGPRWKSWLKSNPTVKDGKLEFGPSISQIAAETAQDLVHELGSNK